MEDDVRDSVIKEPPHSAFAEQCVLGGLMLDAQMWDDIADRVMAEDFYRHEHRVIFAALNKLAQAQKPLDAVTVSDALAADGALESCGGLSYLIGLAQDTPSSANIRSYADIVRDHSIRRQLIHAGSKIIEQGYAREGQDTADLLDEAERKVFDIAERRRHQEQTGVLLSSLVPDAVAEIEKRYEGGGSSGMTTGLKEFDGMTTGLHPGQLIIVAGRPAMGKTSLTMNWVEHVAVTQGQAAAVFSMEMPAIELAMRMISAHGRIHQQNLRTGNLNDEEWARINSAAATLRNSKIVIDDTPALSPNEVRARARRIKREHGLALVVVDYLQLMQVPNTRENRTNEIAEISRSMKTLAKELSVPVVALSQLNRGVEQRDNKRPRMSDLRESGGIEQDADVIVFIYRDEVYNPDSPDKGIAEIIIVKQRNGPTGSVRAAFLGQYTRFDNLAFQYNDDDDDFG